MNTLKMTLNSFDDVLEHATRSVMDEGTTNVEKLTKKISKELQKKDNPKKALRPKKAPILLDLQEVQNIQQNILQGLSDSIQKKSIQNPGLTPLNKLFLGFLLSGNSMQVSEDLVLDMQKASSVLLDSDIKTLSDIITAAYQTNTELPEELVKDLKGILTSTNFKKNGTTSDAKVHWKSDEVAKLKELELKQCLKTINSGDYVVDANVYERLHRNGQSIKINNKDIIPLLRSQFNEDTPRILDYHTKYGLDLAPVTLEEFDALEKFGTVPERFKLNTLSQELLDSDPQASIWKIGLEEYWRLAARRNYLLKTLFPNSKIGFATEYITPPAATSVQEGVTHVVPSMQKQFRVFTDSTGKKHRLIKKQYYQTDEFGTMLTTPEGSPIYGDTSGLSPIKTVFSVDGYNTKISALTPTPNKKVSKAIIALAEKAIRHMANNLPEFFILYTKALRTGDFETALSLAKAHPKLTNDLLKLFGKIEEQELSSMFAGQIHHLDELSKLAIPLLIENNFDIEQAVKKYPEKRKLFEYLRDMVLLPQLLHTGPTPSAHNFKGNLPTSRLGEVLGYVRVGGGTDSSEIERRILADTNLGKLLRLLEFFEKNLGTLQNHRAKMKSMFEVDKAREERIQAIKDWIQTEGRRYDTKIFASKQKSLAYHLQLLQNAANKFENLFNQYVKLKNNTMQGIASNFDGDTARGYIEQLLTAKKGAKLIKKASAGGELVPLIKNFFGKDLKALANKYFNGNQNAFITAAEEAVLNHAYYKEFGKEGAEIALQELTPEIILNYKTVKPKSVNFHNATVLNPKLKEVGVSDIFPEKINLDFRELGEVPRRHADAPFATPATTQTRYSATSWSSKESAPTDHLFELNRKTEHFGSQEAFKFLNDPEIEEFKLQILIPTAKNLKAEDTQIAFLNKANASTGVVEKALADRSQTNYSTFDKGFARINASNSYDKKKNGSIKELLVHENLGHGLEGFLGKNYIKEFAKLPGLLGKDITQHPNEIRATLMEAKFFLWKEAKRISGKAQITPEELNAFISKVSEEDLKQLFELINHLGLKKSGNGTDIARSINKSNINDYRKKIGMMLGIAAPIGIGSAVLLNNNFE